MLVSHIQKLEEHTTFFGCSTVCELANRSKLACLPSILVCSEFSLSLFVNYEDQLSTPSSFLSSVITTALNHPLYHMILDSDLPLLDSTSIANEPMNEDIENKLMNEDIENKLINEDIQSNQEIEDIENKQINENIENDPAIENTNIDPLQLSHFCFPSK